MKKGKGKGKGGQKANNVDANAASNWGDFPHTLSAVDFRHLLSLAACAPPRAAAGATACAGVASRALCGRRVCARCISFCLCLVVGDVVNFILFAFGCGCVGFEQKQRRFIRASRTVTDNARNLQIFVCDHI